MLLCCALMARFCWMAANSRMNWTRGRPVQPVTGRSHWRRGKADALLHHSDQGSQYASEQVQHLLADNGITCSINRAGNVWDNSAMESFFSSLKTERTARKVYRARDEARADVFDYIERFYNPSRRHSALGGKNPLAFDRQAAQTRNRSGINTRQVQISRAKSSPGSFASASDRADVRKSRRARDPHPLPHGIAGRGDIPDWPSGSASPHPAGRRGDDTR